MKKIPLIERPREKLLRYGVERLSTVELLTILLRTGTKKHGVQDLAKQLLRRFPQKQLTEVSIAQLQDLSGIGIAKACEIIACMELGRRLLKNKKAKLLLTPRSIWEDLREVRQRRREHFVVYYLDARNQEIQREIVSVGTLTESIVHPREVFESAITHAAAQVLIAHNHPSGDTAPSEDDVRLTKRLIAAGAILGIEVIDHVIVTKKHYRSMKEEGMCF